LCVYSSTSNQKNRINEKGNVSKRGVPIFMVFMKIISFNIIQKFIVIHHLVYEFGFDISHHSR